MRVVFSVVLSFVACGPAAEVAPEDVLEPWLHGVDLDSETTGLEEAFGREGFVVTRRISGRAYRAFSARSEARETRVRVITRRGVSVAIDATSEGVYEVADLHALEPAGASEVVVRVRERGIPYDCFRPFVIPTDGNAHELAVREGEGLDRCIRRIDDLDGDGNLELIGSESMAVLSDAVVRPRVEIVLDAREGTLVRATASRHRRFLSQLSAPHLDALLDAGSQGDDVRLLRAAVELARLSFHAGVPTQELVRDFDAAVSQFPFTDEGESLRDVVKEHIRSWNVR